MIVLFSVCVAWFIEGECLMSRTYRGESDTWSPLPCIELVPEELRPMTFYCRKLTLGDPA